MITFEAFVEYMYIYTYIILYVVLKHFIGVFSYVYNNHIVW